MIDFDTIERKALSHGETGNCRVKIYPGVGGEMQIGQIMAFSTPLWTSSRDRASRSTEGKKSPENSVNGALDDIAEEAKDRKDGKNTDGIAKAFRRARSQCFDFLMCNPDLAYFVTLTLNQEKVDRYDYAAVIDKLSQWLDNRVRRNGLKYILVPERHRDGAIHFHGVMNHADGGVGLAFKHSGKIKRGRYTLDVPAQMQIGDQIIWNIRDFPLGFSSAIDISGEDCRVKISKYIWKYMTKQGGEKVGGRYYLHGGALEEPMYEYYNIPYELVPGDDFEICDKLRCKIMRL